MAIIVQDDTGAVADAVSYVTVAEFKAYHTIRGNAFSTYSDTQIEQALAKARDFLDSRYEFKGYPVTNRSQATMWPRYDVYDRQGFVVSGVPKEIKEAQHEYAFRALSAPLAVDPTPSATGFPIKSKSVEVDVIKESITYDTAAPVSLPDFPLVDERLRKAGLIRSWSPVGEVMRG